MLRTDLETPLTTSPSSNSGASSRFVRLTCSGILIISCTIFGYTQSYAQQDVAEAARQERARKEKQQKNPKHVYTDEDLKRAQILTTEDRAEVEARKKQQPLPRAEQGQDAMDALTLPADLPLGDVARHYRFLREFQRLQQSAQFHLPVDEPALATPKHTTLVEPEFVAPEPAAVAAPKHSAVPVRPVISIPAPPKMEPYRPSVKRSPFGPPRNLLAPPPSHVPSHTSRNQVTPPVVGETSSSASAITVAPSKPAAPRPNISAKQSPRLAPPAASIQPSAPKLHSAPSVAPSPAVVPSKPATPAPDLSAKVSPRLAPHAASAQPVAPILHAAPSQAPDFAVMPIEPAAPAQGFSVMPPPTRASHANLAQPAAPTLHAAPSQMPDFAVESSQPAPAALDLSVMPSPLPAAHVAPVEPVAPVVRNAPSAPGILGIAPAEPAAPVEHMASLAPVMPNGPGILHAVIAKPGDSLWRIAEETLGKGIRWHELLAVNPGIVDANRIVAGSQIFLPSLVAPARAAIEITLKKGDTLTAIARAHFGRASYWSCIAQANPSIHDANVIYEGETLVIPGSCKR